MKTKGFTLIELMVVITIMGLLSSTVLTSVNNVRSTSRDKVRVQDLKQLQTALELYRTINGVYPEFQGASRGENCFISGRDGTITAGWSQALNILVTSNVIPSLPVDPLYNNNLNGTRPYMCYGYHRTTSTDAYDSCINKKTGEIYLPLDYEYLLYFSVENPDSWDVTMRWNDSPNKPFNACMVGPSRR